MDYLLPKKDYCCANFLNAVLAGQKKLLPMTDVTHKIVPKYKEFKVEEIYKECAEDLELMTYQPDLTMSKKLPDREFVYDVINSIRPKFLKDVVNHAEEIR